MKTNILLLCFSIIVIQFLDGCKKYEEGPRISLKSKKERISNHWLLTKYLENGQVPTSYTSSWDIDIKTNGDYITYTDYSSSGEIIGTWRFSSDKEKITFTEMGGDSYTFTILKLKEKELWLEEKDGNDTYELHLEPK